MKNSELRFYVAFLITFATGLYKTLNQSGWHFYTGLIMVILSISYFGVTIGRYFVKKKK